MSDPRLWTGEDWYKETKDLSEADMQKFAGTIEQICDVTNELNFDNVMIQADFSSLESDEG